ncbi:MAG: inositol 2-dehydrogenase [Gammaproteobacteria bacterium]|nr:inositol 2-dehydrogenase [Gammaproteobacteria bacterium]
MVDQVRFGIIGAGRIGKIHMKNLSVNIPGAKVLAVSDINHQAAVECASICCVPKVYKDYREILNDKDIDAVVICSSTNTHIDIICEAAAAGKHIFCEKPLDHDLSRIDLALAAVKKAGVKLLVGFNRRFDPSFKNARDLVKSGKIGKPHLVRITSRDPSPPPAEYIKVSGGLFLDMAIHDFDMCRYIIGEEVSEIFATGLALVDPQIGKLGDIDTAVTVLNYTSGAICTIDNSRKAVYGYDQRLEVFGSEGCITVGNKYPYNGDLYTATNVAHGLPCHFFLDRYAEAYIEEMRHFMQVINNKEEPLVVGYDGKISVVMALAAKKSLDTKKPVKI